MLLLSSSLLLAEAQAQAPTPPNVSTLGPVIICSTGNSANVKILSPQNNQSYSSNQVQLIFSVQAFGMFGQFGNIGYSLDGGIVKSVNSFVNKTVDHPTDAPDWYWNRTTVFASIVLPSLSEAIHNVTVYYGWQYLGTNNPSLERFEVFAYDSTIFTVANTTNTSPHPNSSPTSFPSPTPNSTITPSTTPTTPNTPSPTQNLIELPYAAGNFYPTPNSTNIALNTTVSISFSRPPSICNLTITPNVAIKEQAVEAEGFGAKYIFYFAQQLKPKTTYNVTVTYGQETAPEGFKPTTTRTWHFITETNTPTQQQTLSPIPSTTVDGSSYNNQLPYLVGVSLIAVGVTSLLAYFKKRKRKRKIEAE